MKARIDDIEVLRGIAILCVLVQHIPDIFPWSVSPSDPPRLGWWVGVDIFFAVSGYVIARQLLPALAAAANPEARWSVIRAFWIRRAWRLLPAAWLWLALILMAVCLFNESGVFGDLQTNLEATAAGVFQYANVRLDRVFGVKPYGVSFPYWSLSLEEQFYLVLPLLVLLCGRRLLWLLLLIVLVRFAIGNLGSAFRVEGLALGVLVAIAQQHNRLAVPDWFGRLPPWVRLALIPAVLWPMLLLGKVTGSSPPPTQGIIALFATALLVIAAQDRGLLRLPRPLHGVVLWFGSRSYSLYLAQIPIFWATRELWFRAGVTSPGNGDALRFGMTACVLLIVAVELSWRFVEQPLRRYGAALASRHLAPFKA
ncbi:acyltransferase [Niveibacterium umoris]|uniref:Peptidoglycan/LPS O-acetylase OafA/YrhL n=1 Tax=Niveibacterium umoris TaxID=1193620 RepID=A0A840BHV8_9RHOO|nr:acyltransferase [Niveibacterium umoris]MBB4012815.1 peptidoglycan/LPS O-acetylase OafA/YrhL [Niveibacterium umoris]